MKHRASVLLVGILPGLSVALSGVGCARTPLPPPPAPKAQATRPAAPAAPAAVPLPQVPARPLPPPTAVKQVSVFFDFDSYALRPEAGPLLQQIAATARRDGRGIKVEGHCDERGTPEYNLALGDSRARSAQSYLNSLGIPKDKIDVVSFGDRRPKALGHDESAWAQNRRGDVMVR
jgi:peptidoglycan-associated lipoprotein